jgi:hypothetical protein
MSSLLVSVLPTLRRTLAEGHFSEDPRRGSFWEDPRRGSF